VALGGELVGTVVALLPAEHISGIEYRPENICSWNSIPQRNQSCKTLLRYMLFILICIGIGIVAFASMLSKCTSRPNAACAQLFMA
jgi:hypothetical protein